MQINFNNLTLMKTIITAIGEMEIYIDDCENPELAIFKALALTSINGKPVTAIVFDRNVYQTATEAQMTFIVHHEVGHFVYKHNHLGDVDTVVKLISAIRNEIMADMYSVMDMGSDPKVAIEMMERFYSEFQPNFNIACERTARISALRTVSIATDVNNLFKSVKAKFALA